MFESQNAMDLQEDSGFGDPRSWLTSEAADAGGVNSGAGRNLDRVLFNDLVEIVPLVQSLIDRKASNTYTRRGSMAYTKTPSREALSRKGRNAAQPMPNKKKRDHGNNEDSDMIGSFPSRGIEAEKEDELLRLRGQLDELERKLSDKDELLKSAEITQSNLQAQLEELQHECAEKESLIRSIQLQLSDTKIKLADKQAALEKTQWEAMTSGKTVEKLQQELSSMQADVSSVMSLFEGLNGSSMTAHSEDYDLTPFSIDESSFPDDLDMSEMHRMEEARLAYIAAVATAKERQDEESIAAAAKARLHLQSFAFPN
ncbi:hypothetical protein SAY86_010161 [Trapa natans]|uniref:Protein MICROTUBULE BINDING PROTEIN 2C n=1 Tax=Trapa natans TaxID=22666 RepID=A0AAN7KY39_TRANT|nr:hypothetical protein SAY86_010161 [Trapa natans]